jgi:hypothetical protein
VRHVTVVEYGPVAVVSTLEMANAGAGGGVGDVVTGVVGAPLRACAPPNRIAPATATRSNADPATRSVRGLGHCRTRQL